LIGGEIIAITYGYLIYRKMTGVFIRTYNLKEWKMKIITKAPNKPYNSWRVYS